jgi:lipid-A-disaccharide synthase-like uncharacterized protein
MILDAVPKSWLALGFLGQAMFSGRFLVQWIVSERKRASVVPTAFWWLSIAGGAFLLTYAVHRGDPVFIVGQAAGLVVYIRNLMLIRQGNGAPQPLGPPKA